MTLLMQLLDERFMPHGHCYFWEPYVLWSYAVADSVIALAYFAIPLTLLYIYLKRRDFSYIWVMILFAVFITSCGITHVFDVINIWHPLYQLDVISRIITALASIATAVVLLKITPSLIGIPTTAEWQKLNGQLQQKLAELQHKDKQLELFKDFRLLTDTLPQLVWTQRKDDRQDYFNERWREYTGLERISRKLLLQIVSPEHIGEFKQKWQQAFQTRTPFTMELRLKRHDGQFRWHLVKVTLVQEGAFWVCSLTDVDDQKMFAEELTRKNQELTAINTDLDNFIYTASHDLKSPLANIEGLTTTLTKKLTQKFVLDEEQTTMLSLIGSSIGRLKSTIRDLTEIAKVQKETTEEEISLVDSLVEEVYEDLRKQATDVILYKDLAVTQLKIAQKNMRSILFNLISNALKYRSLERTPQIRVETRKEGANVVLVVADNGIGIAEKYQHKLFTMFKRFHTHVEGTGVGLYIVKRIVENAGGKIVVDSQVNVGTRFSVYLPDQP